MLPPTTIFGNSLQINYMFPRIDFNIGVTQDCDINLSYFIQKILYKNYFLLIWDCFLSSPKISCVGSETEVFEVFYGTFKFEVLKIFRILSFFLFLDK